MSRESTCRCLICGLERSLTAQLVEPAYQERYRRFAASRALLFAFPTPLALIAYLHTRRNENNGTHSPDWILAELLKAVAAGELPAALRDLLLLAFIPMLHATARLVSASYPYLPLEDVAQHAVASLLEILGAPEFYGRSSHVAFAVSRMLKRKTFEWAKREYRSPVYGASPEAFTELPATFDTAEPIERTAVLRHFLLRCQQRGLLSGHDVELLVQFRSDAGRNQKPGGSAAVYSNAHRQRMKRLLGKLRRIARTPATRFEDHVQLRLF